MPLRPLVPAAAALLAACSSPSEVAERTGVELDEAVRASASASGAQGVALAEETELFHFELAYPAQAAAIPALAAKLEADARAVQREMTAEAQAIEADAAASGYPFNPHGYGAKWQVVADLPGYLSLSNAFSTYSGGAHGMYGVEGFVWDKARGRGLASNELFRSPGELGAAMGQALCAALDRERRARRGDEAIDGMFAECPSLDEATILVGSANGRTFDRITVYFGPYVAGPYAEGPYELDFPMTAAMLGAVKPAYRAAFSAKRQS
jgi:hypothetical protein